MNMPITVDSDGVIAFTLPATVGLTGPELVEKLVREKDVIFGSSVEREMVTGFVPTVGKSYDVRIIQGECIQENWRSRIGICRLAMQNHLGELNLEALCMIGDNFTGEELADLGLSWIIARMDPWSASDEPIVAMSNSRRNKWVNSYYYEAEDFWEAKSNFGFVVNDCAVPIKTLSEIA